jgi:hypothetical protein
MNSFEVDDLNSLGYVSTFWYDSLISKSYEWYWTPKIRRKCLKAVENLIEWERITGKILEEYVWWNIRTDFEVEGYTWRGRDNQKLKTYYIKKNYQSKRAKKNGGIDLFISVMDEHGNNYYCKIECSNWRERRISDKLFDERIFGRHRRYSQSGLAVKCEIIPYYNLEEIRDRCDAKDIIVIPMDKQFLETDLVFEELEINKKWENIYPGGTIE